ncbi:MAG: choloylglycine hydrolase [Clostridia bacterium]|nr:choloylglycine hydrolase [Clostridia bacterium]
MCTAISFKTKDHYFGRNLDLEHSYGESVVVMPRRFPLPFKRMPSMDAHLAMIGMAVVADGQPLYYDAVNETGLCAAALNFPGYARYVSEIPSRYNVAPYELIIWLLAQCSCVSQARALLEKASLVSIPFSDSLPLTPLHFLVCDANESIVVEQTADGLQIHDNPVGILTNSPPFDYHMTRLRDFSALSSRQPVNTFDPAVTLEPYSRGMGAMGLPGDLSSVSRFVRAAFMKAHSLCGETDEQSVTQFFHILDSVSHIRGSVMVGDQPQITVYSCCCNASRGVYFYTTYENRQITAIDMHAENLDGSALSAFRLTHQQQIRTQNR